MADVPWSPEQLFLDPSLSAIVNASGQTCPTPCGREVHHGT